MAASFQSRGNIRHYEKILFVLVALFCLAIWVLHRELAAYHVKDILHHIGLIPAGGLVTALFLTAAGYGIMTIYDLLALRYLKQSLAYAKIALAAFSNNIGLFMIAGASVRYRLYASWGPATPWP